MTSATLAATNGELPGVGETRTRAVLVERARALARPPAAEPTGRRVALVSFALGGVAHALEARFVREVLRRPPISVVPAAPATLIGVASLRGEILAVADVSALLGLAAPNAPGPVIVLEGPGPPLGLLVEEVQDFTVVAADSIASLPHQDGASGPQAESLILGVTVEATVLSATALLCDPRLSATTEPRRSR